MELHVGPAFPDHYEQPQRIMQVYATLEGQGLLARCWQLPPRSASRTELRLAHTDEHIDKVQGLWPRQGQDSAETPHGAMPEPGYYRMGADLFVCKDTPAAAAMAAGCCIQAVRSVLAGEVCRAFAIVRPPGHHAECARAQGFCFYNNVALAAREALQHPGIQRVLVLDWDVHHGNGIQEVLWEDPAILYVSIHRHPRNFYPYVAGWADEVGDGPGRGFNINVPWTKRGMGDADYEAAFRLVVEPVAADFRPDIIVVAAGFDAADGDPIGGCKLTPEGYAAMVRSLVDSSPGGRIVLALEGGYNTRVTAACAAACIRTMLEYVGIPDTAHGMAPDTAIASAPGTADCAVCADPCALGDACPPVALRAAVQEHSMSPECSTTTMAAAGTSGPSPVTAQDESVTSLGNSDSGPATRNARAASPAAEPGSPAAPAETAEIRSATTAARMNGRGAGGRRLSAAEAIAGMRAAKRAGHVSGVAKAGGAVVVAGERAPAGAVAWPSSDAVKVLRQVYEVQALYWPVLAGSFQARWAAYDAELTARQQGTSAAWRMARASHSAVRPGSVGGDGGGGPCRA